MENNNCNKDIEVYEAAELPVDGLESLPDYLLTIRSVYHTGTGEKIQAFTRTPTKRLFTGAMANVVALESNNPALTLEEGQVKAGYVMNNGTMNSVQYASEHHLPKFLIVRIPTENIVNIQSTGLVILNEGHDYIVSAQYYLGENGMPTTNPTSNIKLFTPLSSTVLKIDF